MGFSAPKPDPKLQAQQDAASAQAKRDKISTIQQQLSNENAVRYRLYGSKPLIGGGLPQGSGPVLPSLFGTNFGGNM